ncbi:MAG: SufD family Fe-S cluster assembly protein, partial [Rickettsiales bacterium]|nr:SufD family Fe-S cluster assembly protein [Rickettsiales bacterium]
MVKKKFDYEKKYAAGFQNNLESKSFSVGLNSNVVQKISEIKNEPDDVLKLRLRALKTFDEMVAPKWADFDVPDIDFQKISYYSVPKNLSKNIKSIDEIDPKIKAVYDRLGIPLSEQKLMQGVDDSSSIVDKKNKIAIDAVLDSVSVATTYKEQLAALGIIFCSMSDAIKNHYKIVKKYLCSVVPMNDSFYSALNTAVFSDGTFVYVPKGVKCPIDLGSYFRINAKNAGQFERTLIIADEGAEVNYLEGCSAPQYDENQLHVAVVELIAMRDAVINYSTVQNWYAGDENGIGGIYNFVTKR